MRRRKMTKIRPKKREPCAQEVKKPCGLSRKWGTGKGGRTWLRTDEKQQPIASSTHRPGIGFPYNQKEPRVSHGRWGAGNGPLFGVCQDAHAVPERLGCQVIVETQNSEGIGRRRARAWIEERRCNKDRVGLATHVVGREERGVLKFAVGYSPQNPCNLGKRGFNIHPSPQR